MRDGMHTQAMVQAFCTIYLKVGMQIGKRQAFTVHRNLCRMHCIGKIFIEYFIQYGTI